VVGTGDVKLSSKTAKQRFADISPNCASKPKSMTPSGKMAATSPRCRIASRSTMVTKRWAGPPQRQEWETPMVVESAERRLVAAE
jgi:hypothetical protein